jgi:hypothetical protein
MSDRVMRDNARLYFLPFIIGNGKQAHRLSRKIFHKYGIVSLICGERRTLSDLLDYSCRFLRLCPSDSPRLLCEQLIALSEQSPYTLPIAIPANTRYETMINEARELLEQKFVISSEKELFVSSPLANIK